MNKRGIDGQLLAMAALLIAAGAFAFWQFSPTRDLGVGSALAKVSLPGSLSDAAGKGRELFAGNCASCHGVSGEGRVGLGPPLVHVIYEPNHHSDASFHLAVAHGVRAHHWSFGNMPPVGGITPAEVDLVIAYIRELQQHNGIQ